MLLYTVRRLLVAPVRTSLSLLDAHLFPFVIRRKAGVTVAGPIRVIGWPIVEASGGGEIHIGSDVTLNSRNRGYHVNMHSPVKLFADRRGAIIEIGASSRIHGACVHAYKRITIGRNCLIAANTQIIDCTGHDASFPDVANRLNTHGMPRRVLIEDNVWIGANCVILPGVRVGWGSIIAAGSVVFQGTIPPCSTVAGNPAQVLVSRACGQANRDEHSNRA